MNENKGRVFPALNPLYAYSLAAYQLVIKMILDGRDNEDIKRMAETAQELEKLADNNADCRCVLPEQSCEVCRAVTRYIYNEERQAENEDKSI